MANTLTCMACAYGFTNTMGNDTEYINRLKGDGTQTQIEHVMTWWQTFSWLMNIIISV